MNPEETKAAEHYWIVVIGNDEPKYCANGSYEYFETGFEAGIAYARDHPSAEVLALEDKILLLSERIVECDRIPISIEDLSAQLVGAVEAWRKSRGG